MRDRELLELAAKAAGYCLNGHTQKDWAVCLGGKEWNPLTDDGDALRLAVKLGLTIYSNLCAAYVRQADDAEITAVEDPSGDPYAATRRVIVRAAAEIGRGA
jgi:hypothetical protein